MEAGLGFEVLGFSGFGGLREQSRASRALEWLGFSGF